MSHFFACLFHSIPFPLSTPISGTGHTVTSKTKLGERGYEMGRTCTFRKIPGHGECVGGAMSCGQGGLDRGSTHSACYQELWLLPGTQPDFPLSPFPRRQPSSVTRQHRRTKAPPPVLDCDDSEGPASLQGCLRDCRRLHRYRTTVHLLPLPGPASSHVTGVFPQLTP